MALASFAADREHFRAYGQLNFGDWYGESGWSWGNNEYDPAYCAYIEFLRGGFAGARLPDVVRQWFLGVNGDATLHRRIGGGKVGVIRGADNHEIQLLRVRIQQFSEILVALGGGKCFESWRTLDVIDIRNGDHILIFAVSKCGFCDPARADQGHIEFGVGGRSGFPLCELG